MRQHEHQTIGTNFGHNTCILTIAASSSINMQNAEHPRHQYEKLNMHVPAIEIQSSSFF
jgi:hypothetical protein